MKQICFDEARASNHSAPYSAFFHSSTCNSETGFTPGLTAFYGAFLKKYTQGGKCTEEMAQPWTHLGMEWDGSMEGNKLLELKSQTNTLTK